MLCFIISLFDKLFNLYVCVRCILESQLYYWYRKCARLCWRANFFAFFRDYYPQISSASGNKWGDVLRQTVFSKKFLPFFWKTGCVLISQFQISERAFYQIKNFSETPDNLVLPSGNKWRDKFSQKIFLKKARKWVCISAPFVQMSEEVFHSEIFSRLGGAFDLCQWE